MKEYFTAAGPNSLENSEDENGRVAGFWRGLWHGLIAPISFLVSLFKENVGVYEPHNNGRLYNFGFILGLMIVFGGNNRGAARKQATTKKDEYPFAGNQAEGIDEHLSDQASGTGG